MNYFLLILSVYLSLFTIAMKEDTATMSDSAIGFYGPLEVGEYKTKSNVFAQVACFNVNKFLVQIDAKRAKKKLSKFSIEKRIFAHKFIDSDKDYCKSVEELLPRFLIPGSKKQSVYFIDFDGVMARQVLIRVSDGREFTQVMNTINSLLKPQISHAENLLASPEYQSALNRLVTKIAPLKMSATSKQKVDLVFRALSIFRDVALKTSADFLVRHEIVSEELRSFFEKEKSKGAQFYVLSGRPHDEEKEAFINEKYAGIFNNKKSDWVARLGSYRESCSYIHSEKKYQVLETMISSKEIENIFFIDDHPGHIRTCVFQISNYLRFCFFESPVCVTLIPFPSLSLHFSSVQLIGELIDLITEWDEATVEAVQRKLQRKRKVKA